MPKRVGRGRERMKKEVVVPISSYPTRNRELKKNRKKIKKIKKHYYDFISSQNGSGEAEKERKKKLSIRSVPTQPGIENSNKIAKKLKKIKKHHYGFFSSQNWTGLTEKEKKKNYRFNQLLPDQE